jgi:hypothetical protein
MSSNDRVTTAFFRRKRRENCAGALPFAVDEVVRGVAVQRTYLVTFAKN